MKKRCLTVHEYADRYDVLVDDVLVNLWDLDANEILDIEDRIPTRYLKPLNEKFGLASRKDLKSYEYWQELFGLQYLEFECMLKREGIVCTNRRISPGAVYRLMALARSFGIDALSGTIKKPQTIRNKELPKAETPSRTQPPAPSYYDWKPDGHYRSRTLLTEDDVADIHFALVEDFSTSSDPIDPPGIRDSSILGSAVSRPKTSLGGIEKYPTIESSAAALLHSLILDHPFHNGNKRTALVAMLVFLDRHGMVTTCDEHELFKLVLRVAQHHLGDPKEQYANQADYETAVLNKWICENVRIIEKQEIPIPWRKLKRILLKYECEFQHLPGNRIIISRVRSTPRRKLLTVQSHVCYRDDGSEVAINTLAKIRADLLLDEPNGIDSCDFYSCDPGITSEFILKYRRVLRKLSKW